MSAAENLGEALALLDRYSRIANEAVHMKLTATPEGLVVEIGFFGLPRPLGGQGAVEGVGANGFSLRRLAKALGVGPTTIHFHFEGGVGSVFSAVAQQSLAGVTRPFKPKEEPAAWGPC